MFNKILKPILQDPTVDGNGSAADWDIHSEYHNNKAAGPRYYEEVKKRAREAAELKDAAIAAEREKDELIENLKYTIEVLRDSNNVLNFDINELTTANLQLKEELFDLRRMSKRHNEVMIDQSIQSIRCQYGFESVILENPTTIILGNCISP